MINYDKTSEIEYRVRATMIKLLRYFIVLSIITDIAFFIYYLIIDNFRVNAIEYFFHRLLIPNVLILSMYYYIIRTQKKDLPNERKSVELAFGVSTIGGISGFFHGYYICTWILCSVGLLYSVIYNNKAERKRLLYYCYFFVFLDGLMTIIERYKESIMGLSSTEFYIHHLIISFIIITITYIICNVLRDYIEAMIDAVETAEAKKEIYSTKLRYDSLTGVYTRNFFFKEMGDVFADCSEENPITMAMIDIDNFKMINDTYGHDKGDMVLKRLGDLGRSFGLVESSDEVFKMSRYGGEEFFLIFVEKDPAICYKVLEMMMLEFAATDYDFTDKKITLSAGMITCKTPQPFYDVFKKVDNALYESKNTGKNKITVADMI
ncbi:MAG: GGDEF domain-containing protein [Butyrivibrio sp.]|nr:GGDEF domain-containing protein [Butyrivibrio sp.]